MRAISNRERGTLRIHRGKGHKPRTVGLDATAFALIDRWRATKTERGLDPQTLLLCTLRGGAIASSSQIRDMLKRRAKKAGIDKRVHPHGLRYTHATELIAEGQPMNALQKHPGNSCLATTYDLRRSFGRGRGSGNWAPSFCVVRKAGRQRLAAAWNVR